MNPGAHFPFGPAWTTCRPRIHRGTHWRPAPGAGGAASAAAPLRAALRTVLALGAALAGLAGGRPCAAAEAPAVRPRIVSVSTDRARYAPGEPVRFDVEVAGMPTGGTSVQAAFYDADREEGAPLRTPVATAPGGGRAVFTWLPPARDFTGYFVALRLVDGAGRELDRSQTAVDVSSDWSRFPRYGFLSVYSARAGADPERWISELNRYHINGLEYYDFQYHHERPLAGTVAHPAPEWREIAGREVDASVLRGFLAQARGRGMVSLAYNASYSAYRGAFEPGTGISLRWAVWPDAGGPRTAGTVMRFTFPNDRRWETPFLYFMNQNDPGWQAYLFGQMARLFRVYPFDGWHVDSFGAAGGFAYDGSRVDFVKGFGGFVRAAKASLGVRLVLNTVNAAGQEALANAPVDIVYSELWDGHETYASILRTADAVHRANPDKGLVFPAYLHRGYTGPRKGDLHFREPSVLLADAVIFASGADHIELGDDLGMLCSEYFPDRRFSPTPGLLQALRGYYDFATAYETLLRYRVGPAGVDPRVAGAPSSADGRPGTVWAFARRARGLTVLHFINLTGSDDPHWRDVGASRPAPVRQKDLRVSMPVPGNLDAVLLASPDFDGGRMQRLPFTMTGEGAARSVIFTVPRLDTWDMVVLRPAK